MSYTRFAVYYVPPDGPLADFGATWLGWDIRRGAPEDQPDVTGIAAATEAPRKYGFHATLKPPFRLADGATPDTLDAAVGQMAARCAPGQTEGLAVTPLGRFLALTLRGDAAPVSRIAATCVEALDRFRAPASAAELARRRKARLTERQEMLLARWGYPYVFEEFRFHLTLTGRLPRPELPAWAEAVEGHLPRLPDPFVIDSVALVGERADGHFELVQRYALTG
ncbi:DUF1045 domain-containing protein [Sulfitobacter sp. HNIBRBA3233]|uniref:DUF1045 domain-containing protein n=1 Tax=Sulfitobacter marinivivus TaxID=3158558 RepID=UPI0032E01472